MISFGEKQCKDYLPVIHPNIRGLLDTDCITVGGKDVLADEVSNDNIALLPDKKTNAHEF